MVRESYRGVVFDSEHIKNDSYSAIPNCLIRSLKTYFIITHLIPAYFLYFSAFFILSMSSALRKIIGDVLEIIRYTHKKQFSFVKASTLPTNEYILLFSL